MTHELQESFHDSNGEGEEVTAFTLTDLQENQKYQVLFISFFSSKYSVHVHCRKAIDLPVPIREVTDQTLPGLIKLLPPRESLISDIPAWGREV